MYLSASESTASSTTRDSALRKWAHSRSRPRLLLLLAVEGTEAATRHLHYLEANARDVANRVPAASEARDQDLVVLIDEVQAAVTGDERGDFLAVLDQLHAAALADRGVRLLRLDPDLLDDDALRVRGPAEGVTLVPGSEVRLLVVLVCPPLRTSADDQLTRGANTTRLPSAHDFSTGSSKCFLANHTP